MIIKNFIMNLSSRITKILLEHFRSNLVSICLYGSKGGELKIISIDLAHKLVHSAGLRNMFVHEYDQLEYSMVLKVVNMAEELFPQYIKEINDYF